MFISIRQFCYLISVNSVELDIDFTKESYLMLNILFYIMNSDWKIMSMFSLLRAHPSFEKKTTTMNRLRYKIAQATLEINETSCFYPKAR